ELVERRRQRAGKQTCNDCPAYPLLLAARDGSARRDGRCEGRALARARLAGDLGRARSLCLGAPLPLGCPERAPRLAILETHKACGGRYGSPSVAAKSSPSPPLCDG